MGGTNGSWWGEGKYRLGGEPSPHVARSGLAFLARHRQMGPIVDLGVWEGRNLASLLTLGVAVVATDTPEAREVVAKTREHYPNVRYEEAHLEQLPFGSGKIGGALCWRVLHNLTDDGKFIAALAEVNRILAANTPLVIAVRSEHQRDFWAQRHAYIRRLPNGNGGIREDVYFTRGGLQFIVELLGFRVERLFEDVEGGEEIDGKVIKHHYLVAHLLKASRPARGHLDVANRLIVRVG